MPRFARLAYLTALVGQLALLYYISQSIDRKNDQRELNYHVPGNSLLNVEEKNVTTTVQEYDREKLWEALKNVMFTAAFMAFLHLKWEYNVPLVIQSLLPIRTYLGMPLVKIHVLGESDTGDLKRPWKAGLENMWGSKRAMASLLIRRRRSPGLVSFGSFSFPQSSTKSDFFSRCFSS